MTPEVRRCAKCGQTSVVKVFEWNHTTYGASTGQSTRDYRCQSCGAKFSIYPKANVIGLFIAGVLTLMACIPGLVILPIAFVRWKRDSWNPLVPGAPLPPMQYRDGPPRRRCGLCQGEAILKRVTRSTHNGIPTGTEYEYACAPCNKAFVIESLWGHLFTSFAAAVCLAIGIAIAAYGDSLWLRLGLGGLFLAGGVLVVVQTTTRATNRLRYPALD